MTITIRSNLTQVEARLKEVALRQFPYAITQALNNVARIAEKKLQSAMDSQFNRPTPFTKRAIFIQPAKLSLNKMTTSIGLKDAQKRYLGIEIDGGKRGPGSFGWKSFERKLSQLIGKQFVFTFNTSFFRANAYGNLSLSTMVKFAADLAEDMKKPSMPTRISTHAGLADNGHKYWINLQTTGHFPPGIYIRYGPQGQAGGMGRGLIRIVAFGQSFSYQKRFRYFDIVDETVNDELMNAIRDAWLRSIVAAR